MIEIKTKDSDEAAFFWVHDKIELKKVEIAEGYKKKILWFVFDGDISEEEFEKLKTDYRNGKTLVEPKLYSTKRAEVKNLIRENIFA